MPTILVSMPLKILKPLKRYSATFLRQAHGQQNQSQTVEQNPCTVRVGRHPLHGRSKAWLSTRTDSLFHLRFVKEQISSECRIAGGFLGNQMVRRSARCRMTAGRQLMTPYLKPLFNFHIENFVDRHAKILTQFLKNIFLVALGLVIDVARKCSSVYSRFGCDVFLKQGGTIPLSFLLFYQLRKTIYQLCHSLEPFY